MSETNQDNRASVHRRGSSGVDLIAAERLRQESVEGWTPEHDDGYQHNELIRAAIAYLEADARGSLGYLASPIGWPWDESWWKPTPNDRIRELVKAGALIAAEIDRLQRKPG